MSQNNQEGLRSLLKEMIAKHGLAEPQLDALLEYTFSQSNNNEQEVVARLSDLVGQNLSGVMHVQTGIQMELQKHFNEDIRRKLESLEQKTASLCKSQPASDVKFQIVQGLFSAISFIASTVAFLKVFGIITLNFR